MEQRIIIIIIIILFFYYNFFFKGRHVILLGDSKPRTNHDFYRTSLISKEITMEYSFKNKRDME